MSNQQRVLGLDVGGTKILGLALGPMTPEVHGVGRIAGRSLVPSPHEVGPLVDVLEALARELGAGALKAVGLGLPGFIGHDGIAAQAPNLKSIIGVDVRGQLAERLGVPVFANNDANCTAWAVRAIDAPQATDVVVVTLGTGIGGGFISGGALVRGDHGFAGEFGHMIVDSNGPECPCGQRGCWEMWASGNGLTRLTDAALAAGELPTLFANSQGVPIDGRYVMERVVEAEGAERSEAERVVRTYAGWVALGVVNLINIADPEMVVFSGGIVEHGSLLLGEIRAAMASRPTVVKGRAVDLRISSLGPDAGAFGAALFAEAGAAAL